MRKILFTMVFVFLFTFTKIIICQQLNYNPELDKKVKWRFSEYMPTMLDLITFMCINHEAMHLSQLAAWRRAMGLPSALASL